jgi:Mg2+ and Co2+ transporter CorA
MVSLALMQRISILRFSAEVTRISTLAMDETTKMVDRIDDFYMAYIRFVNQSHFLEVTGQQHGIDLYDLLLDSMRIKEQVQDLDNEVEELHRFAAVLEEKSQGRNIKLLTLLGSLFLVPSFIAGFYGMNLFPDTFKQNIPLLTAVIVLIFLIAGGLWGILSLSRQENKKFINFLITAIILMVIIVMGLALGAAM